MVSLVRSMVDDHPARPCVVLSNDPGAGGLAKARDMGIATEVVSHKAFGKNRAGFDRAVADALARHSPDILCLAGFMRILGGDFVAPWEGRMLNIHPSLLPKYPGLHTHKRAIDAGDAEAGVTVHQVTAELDAGPIVGQARVPILEGDTPETLAARVLVEEHTLYPACLRKLATSLAAG